MCKYTPFFTSITSFILAYWFSVAKMLPHIHKTKLLQYHFCYFFCYLQTSITNILFFLFWYAYSLSSWNANVVFPVPPLLFQNITLSNFKSPLSALISLPFLFYVHFILLSSNFCTFYCTQNTKLGKLASLCTKDHFSQ